MSDPPAARIMPDEDDTSDPEPYPSNVVSIIDAVANIGLVVGAVGGLVGIVVGFAHIHTDGGYSIIGGTGFIILGAVHWAFFKAVTLALTYLWRIQFELAYQADTGH